MVLIIYKGIVNNNYHKIYKKLLIIIFMAQIISISLNKEILNEMDIIQKELGFSGRSEIVRAGVRALTQEYRKLSELSGICEGTVIVTHDESNTDEFSRLRHSLHGIVTTHIHHELKNSMCMEIVLFKGDAEMIRNFYKKLISSKKIDTVKVVVS